MQTAWSASRVCSEPASAVEYTATASTPSSCSARMTRTATSPRFATRTRENIALESVYRTTHDGLEFEQQLPELDGLRVLDEDPPNDAVDVGLDLVHELHRLEDAERLSRTDGLALLDEGRRSRFGCAVERPDHRRLDPDHSVGR